MLSRSGNTIHIKMYDEWIQHRPCPIAAQHNSYTSVVVPCGSDLHRLCAHQCSSFTRPTSRWRLDSRLYHLCLLPLPTLPLHSRQTGHREFCFGMVVSTAITPHLHESVETDASNSSTAVESVAERGWHYMMPQRSRRHSFNRAMYDGLMY